MSAVGTPRPRIVSLLPSATEIVCALDLIDNLVGRSHECDYPEAVSARPVVTSAKVSNAMASGEIDRAVKDLAAEALSVYAVDSAKLGELEPDIVITQTQCEACAVSLDQVEAALEDWAEGAPRLVSLAPRRIDDLWADIETVAEAAGVTHRAEALNARLRGRLAEIAMRTMLMDPRPRIACIEWLEPLMFAGHWMPELVACAGGDVVFGKPGAPSGLFDMRQLIEADPEVVFVMPCGFDIQRTRKELSLLTERDGWSDLTAVKEGRVFLFDGNAYFNRSGPRLIESLEIMAEALHPRAFDLGFEGKGWERL